MFGLVELEETHKNYLMMKFMPKHQETPLLKIVSRKKNIGLFRHHVKFERQVHVHGKRRAHKKNDRSVTRSTKFYHHDQRKQPKDI